MSSIRENLRFMNPMEIILNGEIQETIKEFFLLTKNEQEEFIKDSLDHFSEIKGKLDKFLILIKERQEGT